MAGNIFYVLDELHFQLRLDTVKAVCSAGQQAIIDATKQEVLPTQPSGRLVVSAHHSQGQMSGREEKMRKYIKEGGRGPSFTSDSEIL